MAKEKTYKFKMNNPAGKIPNGGKVEKDILLMPRLMRPKELKKYDLEDLNTGFKKLTIFRSSIGMKQQELLQFILTLVILVNNLFCLHNRLSFHS